MSTMASQITSVLIVCSTVCTDADQRKHQSSASLAFVRGIHRWPMCSPHKGPVTRKIFSFDDAIMNASYFVTSGLFSLNANVAATKWPPVYQGHYKRIFLNWNISISIKILFKFASTIPMNNMPSFFQTKSFRKGDKPLFESMVAWFTDAHLRHRASLS